MANFMFILLTILETCPENGEDFLVAAFLEPNYDYFKYSYTFNAKGEIMFPKLTGLYCMVKVIQAHSRTDDLQGD